jgi:hypothetical protein
VLLSPELKRNPENEPLGVETLFVFCFSLSLLRVVLSLSLRQANCLLVSSGVMKRILSLAAYYFSPIWSLTPSLVSLCLG